MTRKIICYDQINSFLEGIFALICYTYEKIIMQLKLYDRTCMKSNYNKLIPQINSDSHSEFEINSDQAAMI